MPGSPDALARFLPSCVLDRLRDHPGLPTEPWGRRGPVATLLADVSGFTARTEALVRRGPHGVEQAKLALDGFFGALVDQVHAHGGDVLKFTGDGLLACWDGSAEGGGLAAAVQRASLCALASRDRLRSARPTGVEVRMLIGAGELSLECLGGNLDRWELAVGGPALTQLQAVDGLARPDQIVATSDAVAAASGGLVGPQAGPGVRLVDDVAVFPGLPRTRRDSGPEMVDGMCGFIPRAVISSLGSGYEDWVAELRPVTVLFVSLPELDVAPWDQAAIAAVQDQLYRHEGSLNKLGADPHGIMALMAFGLPPLAHEQDALRGARTAVALQRALDAAGRTASIGVATGRAFCGIVGTEERCEYTLIGDVVNLAARLAQAARGRVLVDQTTVRRCRGRAAFDALDPIRVKGKRDAIPVYAPG